MYVYVVCYFYVACMYTSSCTHTHARTHTQAHTRTHIRSLILNYVFPFITVAGLDYTGVVRGTATFRAGETTTTVQVPILDDDEPEGPKSFNASLSIPDSAGSLGVSVGSDDTATVNIEDNDGECVAMA